MRRLLAAFLAFVPVLAAAADGAFRVPPQVLPLSPPQQAVRDAAVARVEADIDGYVHQYLELDSVGGGDAPLLVSSDEADRLFPEYLDDPGANSAAVHEAAVAVAEEVWRQALRLPDPRGLDRVLILGGGAASGKTTALRESPALARLRAEAQLVYDATLSMYEGSRDRIDRALAAGKTVTVVYVYAPIELAVRRAVERAARDGRVVPVPALAASHWFSQQTVLRLAADLAEEPRVRVFSLDASAAGAALAPIDRLREHAYADRFPDLPALERYVEALLPAELERFPPSARTALGARFLSGTTPSAPPR